jgi:hypothetical protein
VRGLVDWVCLCSLPTNNDCMSVHRDDIQQEHRKDMQTTRHRLAWQAGEGSLVCACSIIE